MKHFFMTTVSIIVALGLSSCGADASKVASKSGTLASSAPGIVTAKPWTIPNGVMDNSLPIPLEDRPIGPENILVRNGNVLLFGESHFREGDDQVSRPNDILISEDAHKWFLLVDKLTTPDRGGFSIGHTGKAIILYGGVSYSSLTGPWIDQNNMIEFPMDGGTPSVYTGLPKRVGASLTWFNDALYVAGGYEDSSVLKVVDHKVVSQSQLPDANARSSYFQSWVYHDALFVTDSDGRFWKSRDGASWEKIKIETGFVPRTASTVITRGDDWFLAGGLSHRGEDREGACNDVWKSSDEGRNWTLLSLETDSRKTDEGVVSIYGTHSNSFTPRGFAAGFVLKGRLIIGGGTIGLNPRNLQDFWASDDGVTWEQLK